MFPCVAVCDFRSTHRLNSFSRKHLNKLKHILTCLLEYRNDNGSSCKNSR